MQTSPLPLLPALLENSRLRKARKTLPDQNWGPLLALKFKGQPRVPQMHLSSLEPLVITVLLGKEQDSTKHHCLQSDRPEQERPGPQPCASWLPALGQRAPQLVLAGELWWEERLHRRAGLGIEEHTPVLRVTGSEVPSIHQLLGDSCGTSPRTSQGA